MEYEHYLWFFLPMAVGIAIYRVLEADDDKPDMDTTFIGIDLGTTYSCVSVFMNGTVKIIVNDQGNRRTPSYVAFTADGRRLIGDVARSHLTSNPENTIFDVKRFIGRTWDDPAVQRDSMLYQFRVIDKNNKPHFEIKTDEGLQTFAPEEISAMMLGKMKEMAEDYLGKKIYNAVVTVPAYFNDAQRSATKDAATIAGFKFVRIMNEPSVAAMSPGIIQTNAKKKIIVFDLGGGTFDVSLIKTDNGFFETVSTNGNTHLGGEDFDQRVMDHFIKLYKKKTGKDIRSDNRAVQKLRREVEKAKRALSSDTEFRLEIESFERNMLFTEVLTRTKFEELNMDLFLSTLTSLKLVLEDADLEVKDIDDYVLVGGSTRIPKIRELVIEFFKGKKPRQGINPDEAVARGAGVQAGILSGDKQSGNIVFVDVSTFSLGFETSSGAMKSLIPRYTVLPSTNMDTVTTAKDNQENLQLNMYEGDGLQVKDNHLLGSYVLPITAPGPRGFPQITCSLEIDVNGILKVSTMDKSTGSIEEVVIKNMDRLSRKDIKRMIERAKQLRDKDKKFRDRDVMRQDLEKSFYSLRHQLKKGFGGKLTEKEKESLSEFLDQNVVWLDNSQDAEINDIILRKMKFDEFTKPILESWHKQNGRMK